MLHKFISSSQVYVKCTMSSSLRTIKFNMMDNGSYYNTRDEAVAEQIRKHKMFRLGRIKEFIVEECEPQTEEVRETKTQEDESAPIKTKLTGRRFSSQSTLADASNATAVHEEYNEGNHVDAESEEYSEDANNTIELEDIKFYLEAKNYLKNVLHVEPQLISTKQKVQDYCTEHGIVFPNLKW